MHQHYLPLEFHNLQIWNLSGTQIQDHKCQAVYFPHLLLYHSLTFQRLLSRESRCYHIYPINLWNFAPTFEPIQADYDKESCFIVKKLHILIYYAWHHFAREKYREKFLNTWNYVSNKILSRNNNIWTFSTFHIN